MPRARKCLQIRRVPAHPYLRHSSHPQRGRHVERLVVPILIGTARVATTTSFPPGPLRVKNVGVSIGGTRILKSVNLTLHPGEMCALIGPSGAGKSTLIRALLDRRDPGEGSVVMGRQAVAEQGPLGYVPQDDALHRGGVPATLQAGSSVSGR